MGCSRTIRAIAGLAAVTLISACGPSDSRYLSDADEQVYLRVPRAWRELAGPEAIDRLVEQTAQATIVSKYVVSAQGDVSEAGELSGQEPYAAMTVYELDSTLNERMSNSLARTAGGGLGFDPALPTDDVEGLTEVLDYDPDPGGADIAGSRIVYRYRESAEQDWAASFDLTTYFDPVARRLYVLEIGCVTECFERSAEEIARVAGSWQIGK